MGICKEFGRNPKFWEEFRKNQERIRNEFGQNQEETVEFGQNEERIWIEFEKQPYNFYGIWNKLGNRK